jgi:hypothetical protein
MSTDTDMRKGKGALGRGPGHVSIRRMTLRTAALTALGLALAFGPATVAVAQETASAQPEATVGGLLASPSSPRPASLDAELDAIAAQLGTLATSKAAQDKVVRGAVDHGKRAVLQAMRALASGDGATAARKKAMARAALELGLRAAARREETRAESAASQNVTRSEQEQAQAAVLLEQAQEQLRRLQAEPAP